MKVVYFGPVAKHLNDIKGLQVITVPAIQGWAMKVKVVEPDAALLQPGNQVSMAATAIRNLLRDVPNAPPIVCVAPAEDAEALLAAGAQQVLQDTVAVREALFRQQVAIQAQPSPRLRAVQPTPRKIRITQQWSKGAEPIVFEWEGEKYTTIPLPVSQRQILEAFLSIPGKEWSYKDLKELTKLVNPTATIAVLMPKLEPIGFEIKWKLVGRGFLYQLVRLAIHRNE